MNEGRRMKLCRAPVPGNIFLDFEFHEYFAGVVEGLLLVLNGGVERGWDGPDMYSRTPAPLSIVMSCPITT